MRFGLQKTTLLDFPDRVAAILFTGGCNLRCPYCHNPDLIFEPDGEDLLSEDEIEAFLKKRASVLGGVVISGGEPLIHGEKLLSLIGMIHSLGLAVKVDTNGLFPELLPSLNADFIAMDIKTSPRRYGELGCTMDDFEEKLTRSARWIIESGRDHHFRTTLCEELVSEKDVESMASLIKGCREHRLTPFRPGMTLSPSWNDKNPPSPEYVKKMEALFINNEIPSHIA
ncbi:MAG: anaerobic ribonucleoside-triphosphate reductase activating protein [Spirochaetales bacterium]|nr:anaerobic ribonucleoside-triphosphate reductase activating protein [Spirochaetales bacterium]